MAPIPQVSALRAFREPIVPAEVVAPESPEVSFGDLVRMLAEGIADAQASLDRASAELVTELAATRVSVVPQITETVDEQGNVKFESAAPLELSLLELGVTPTFYGFSQATVEVALDVKVVESTTSTETGKRFGLFAGTRDIRVERKLNRDVTMASKLSATLVPVPSPLRVEPVRTTTAPTGT
jgi:hypothetical protein